ncbi:MAG: NUDIX domain-containing protein [Runella zeae]
MTSPKILPAVAAAIFNTQGEVLLQRRKDVNQWCIISGHVEYGESIQEAILREIYEEANVSAKIVRLIGIYSSPDFQTYHYPEQSVQYVTSYFEVNLLEEIGQDFSKNESFEFKFFNKNDLPQEMALINPHWLEDALDTANEVFLR